MKTNNIRLRNISAGGGVPAHTELDPITRLRYGRQLSKAVKGNPDLAREHPYPAAGYRNWPRAYRRLGQAADMVAQIDFVPFVVLDGPRAIGIATAEKTRIVLPRTASTPRTPNPLITHGIEISYWHEKRDPHDTFLTGVKTVKALTRAIKNDFASPEAEAKQKPLWMVTLPDDKLKAEVCQETAMEPLGEPQEFNLNDGVLEPRQLWVRTDY